MARLTKAQKAARKRWLGAAILLGVPILFVLLWWVASKIFESVPAPWELFGNDDGKANDDAIEDLSGYDLYIAGIEVSDPIEAAFAKLKGLFTSSES